MLVSWNCIFCNTEHASVRWKSNRKYCNQTCKWQFEQEERIKDWVLNGRSWNTNFPDWAKEYLKRTNGNCCHICGTLEWNGKELKLEGDHIDGNPYNNDPKNVRLVCPNCHSQTPTYKNKNKGNGRQHRRTKIK